MALQRLTRMRYQLIKQLTRTKQHFLENLMYKCNTLAREMRALEKNVKDLDKAIEQLVVVILEYQCLTSIPCIGKVYAAGLIAEIGQIESFADQTKLAKYAGLSWKIKQSGNYQSQNTSIDKARKSIF